jgi:hypothetical protein
MDIQVAQLNLTFVLCVSHMNHCFKMNGMVSFDIDLIGFNSEQFLKREWLKI